MGVNRNHAGESLCPSLASVAQLLPWRGAGPSHFSCTAPLSGQTEQHPESLP